MVNNTTIYEEISSSDEEPILNGQFSVLLLQLEKDLEKLKNDNDKDLSDHFKELEGLKKIATLPVINIKDITRFLETGIFALMVKLPRAFSFKPLTIYECMLKSAESFPKSVYQEHLQVLLGLKNDEIKDLILLREKNKLKDESKQSISIVRPFFSILSAAKTKKRISSESNNVSAKRFKLLREIPPLTLPSKNVSNQVDDECRDNLLQSGMKLP